MLNCFTTKKRKPDPFYFFCLFFIVFTVMIVTYQNFANAAESYQFDKMWPDKRHWYFDGPIDNAIDNIGNVYVLEHAKNKVLKFTSEGTYITEWGCYGSEEGQFKSPCGISTDANGNIYVADSGNNRIQVFNNEGTFIRMWGGFGQGIGEFNGLIDLAIDSIGRVFVVDSNNKRIQIFNTEGAFIQTWENSGQFIYLTGITIDRNGYVYIIDYRWISKFSSNGTFITKWGGFGYENGQFSNPLGIATDSCGNVYVTEERRIQKFSPDGAFLTTWGSNGTGAGEFGSARGVAIDGTDNVYIADNANKCIQKFTAQGELIANWSRRGNLDGEFDWPYAVVLDSANNVYVTDLGNSRIQKFTSEGVFITKWGSNGFGEGQFDCVTGISIDTSGNIYASDQALDWENNSIQKFTPDGTFLCRLGQGGPGLNGPEGIAIDEDGNIYVTDSGNCKIQKFASDGTFIIEWGSFGSDEGGNGEFRYPIGIAVDNKGFVYVTDADNNNIQKFTVDGSFVTVFGGWGWEEGRFNQPRGIAIDNGGNIYVADRNNHRIQKLNAQGVFMTALGKKVIVDVGGTEGDGEGEFNSPHSVAIDANGAVYVVDSGNSRIQKFVPTVSNNPPAANAGQPQTVHVGSIVTLDGSLSSDPDGNVPLSYAWNIVGKPVGSFVALSAPTSVNPIFSPDVPGDYMLELVVTDSMGAQSVPATITISTLNTMPIAEAGPDQLIIRIGSTIQLNGTQSYDNDGDPISYQWIFASRPAGSTATLSGANTATPGFVVDVYGIYVLQLVVSDPWVAGTPDLVSITFDNIRPVANAGNSLSVEVFQTVTLDGSGSTDANDDSLTYNWTLVSVPLASTTTIADPTAINTTFVPDQEGSYVVQLIVHDGFEASEPNAIQIEAVAYSSIVTQSVQQAQSLVIAIPLAELKNTNMQNTLLNKLNAVISSIDAGNYADALAQLEDDILGKTNGCATGGAPDNNDWVKTCSSQNQLYPAIIQTINLLERLIP